MSAKVHQQQDITSRKSVGGLIDAKAELKKYLWKRRRIWDILLVKYVISCTDKQRDEDCN